MGYIGIITHLPTINPNFLAHPSTMFLVKFHRDLTLPGFTVGFGKGNPGKFQEDSRLVDGITIWPDVSL